MLISSRKTDDNLIDLSAYGEAANTYVQDIAIDNAKFRINKEVINCTQNYKTEC